MSIDSYVEAKAAFYRHDQKLKDLAKLLSQVSDALRQQPGRMIFANTGTGLPAEASMMKDSRSFNADDFKTPNQMQDMLAEWHRLHTEMISKWGALSTDAKANVSGPESRPQASR